MLDQTGERRADVAIEDGRIVEVGSRRWTATTVLDATGCIVAPGFVDLHVHLREPGREEAETIETGSRAAALGGFTAVVAMPNTDPAQDSRGRRSSSSAPRAARAGLCEVLPGRLHHHRTATASSWRRSASWPRPACTCSPTTATACRTRS